MAPPKVSATSVCPAVSRRTRSAVAVVHSPAAAAVIVCFCLGGSVENGMNQENS